MKRVIVMGMTAVLMVSSVTMTPAPASAAPYVSCPGGYIADSGENCPPFRTPVSVYPGKAHGGGGSGGGLLGTIGRIVGGIL